MSDSSHLDLSVFFSYAREDRLFLNGLIKPLIPLQRVYGFQLLEDSRVGIGENWEARIHDYLAQAQVAILLLSADFIASEFILNVELPILLERYNRNELQLLPVIVGRVDLEPIGLKQLQTIPPPERPLKSVKSITVREDYYFEVAARVKDIMQQLSSGEAVSASTLDVSGSAINSIALKPSSWNMAVPADEMAASEIEHQLSRLIRQTKHRGILVFTCGKHYVQYAYFKEFDADSIIIEVISNAFLPKNYPLSKLQLRHLAELKFTQRSEEENLQLLAPIHSDGALSKLSTITWHILNNILNCRLDADLEVYGQCW